MEQSEGELKTGRAPERTDERGQDVGQRGGGPLLARPGGWLLAAGPVRALLESLLGLALALLCLALLSPQLAPYILRQSYFFAGVASLLYLALRLRLPGGSWKQQARVEVPVGAAGLLAASLLLLLFLVIFSGIMAPDEPGFTRFLVLVLLPFVVHSVLFAGARLALRLWRRWEQLRRRHLIWSLAHTHLVVALMIIPPLFLIFLGYVSTRGQAISTSLPAMVVERLAAVVLPHLVVLGGLLLLALLLLLPPSALASFLIARRMTRRLEALALAASELRAGNLRTRVEVTGEDEVAQLQADFNGMAEDLERTMQELQRERDRVTELLEARRELIASVSHELHTPVATLRGYLDSTLGGGVERLPERLQQDLRVMERETRRLQTLIDDLFTLSHATVRQLTFQLVPIQVERVAQRCVQAIKPLAWKTSRIQIVAESEGELPPALADVGRLEQILFNLLHNAVGHTPPGGIVAVLSTVDDTSVRVEVRDTGEGIPPEGLDRIWERFYRGERAENMDGGGSGLGLALVKELVEAMGGTVEATSMPGEGSNFIVRLPLAEPVEEEG